ncbi:MAG: glycosyltransferase family 4 protein, partial [Nanoarchaeota archaeon]|nr:glycosyltransferase family 4 protein [Nanoarchaeota archaeon]
MLSGMLEMGERASKIVLNMLTFSRKSESEKVQTNMQELIENTLELAANDYSLKKKYDFKLTIISDVPHELKNKYRNDKNIVFHSPTIPRQRVLDEFFSTTDIFVLPSYMDTFGMVFLEAMSYKLPIIATNVFAIPEIIKNSGIAINVDKYSWYGKDCLFAWKSWEEFCRHMEKEDKPDISKSIAINISKLIEDGRLRKKLGNAGRFDVEKGKFSIENRNKKLKRIYEEAIK